MRFDGRVIVISGAASGLGRAFAIALALRGASLALIDAQPLTQTKAAVEALGGKVTCWQCDVADEVQITSMSQQVLQQFNQVDGLVLSAGVHVAHELDKMTVQDWRNQLRVDFDGAFLLSRAFWPQMKLQGYGRVLLLTGASGLFGDQFECAFATAKMGVLGLANCMSREGADYNIRVNTLCAQALTPMTEKHMAADVAPMFSMEMPVAAAIYLLCNESPSGQHLLAAAGTISRVQIAQSKPLHFSAANCNPEAIKQAWSKLSDVSMLSTSKSGEDQMVKWAESASKEHGIFLK